MYIVVIFIIFIVFFVGNFQDVKLIKTGEKICKYGIHGKGIIKNYDRVHSLRRHIFCPKYHAVVEFYVDTQLYTMLAMGTIFKRKWKIGEEVEIVYWDEYDEYVILKDFDFISGYVIDIVFHSILGAILLISLLILYMQGEPFPVRSLFLPQ